MARYSEDWHVKAYLDAIDEATVRRAPARPEA